MGEKDRLRKLAWPMKQGSFERIEGTKAARCSDGEFGIGVQCLDDSGRHEAFGTKPVENERFVITQGTCKFLERGNARAHDVCSPAIDKPTCPGWGTVLPECAENLREVVGADGEQVESHDIIELQLLTRREILQLLEKAPAGVLEDRIALRRQLACRAIAS